jgi:hypothetical protein
MDQLQLQERQRPEVPPVGTDLGLFSMLPENVACALPEWLSYPMGCRYVVSRPRVEF